MAYLPSVSALTSDSKSSRPLTIVRLDESDALRETLSASERAWLNETGASKKAGALWLLPGKKGLGRTVFLVKAMENPFPFGELAERLPQGLYHLAEKLDRDVAEAVCLGFGLGSYGYQKYKTRTSERARLVWPEGVDRPSITARLEAFYLARDLINTPARDMSPADLEEVARELTTLHKAQIQVTTGEALVRKKYEMIHAVGQAAAVEPRLIDMRWGKPSDPLVTLVGKGVCFDTGGLDLKPPQYMKLMKKDMGGAALTLALAHLLMAQKLAIRLRVLVPAVENSVGGNAFHPLDVLRSKKGLTVEVGDTDAEGRLILADPLSDAAEEDPDLLIDAATLTGAARVALGTQMPAIFANRNESWRELESASQETFDWLWRLPLHEPYRRKLDSKIADLSNIGDSYAGAITAALFLEEFAKPARDWVHVDTMGYNLESSPGRPAGGEAQGLLALERWLVRRYQTTRSGTAPSVGKRGTSAPRTRSPTPRRRSAMKGAPKARSRGKR